MYATLVHLAAELQLYPQIAKLSCQAERIAAAQSACGPGAVIGVVVAFGLPQPAAQLHVITSGPAAVHVLCLMQVGMKIARR